MTEDLENYFNDIANKRIVRPIHLNHLSKADERDQSAGTAKRHLFQSPITPWSGIADTDSDIDATPGPEVLRESLNTAEASDMSTDEDSGQIQRDLYQPFFSTLVPGGMFIDEEPTWLLIPAVHPTAPFAQKAQKNETREAGAEDQSHALLIRNLIKSSGIYALASIASPFISLVLAPFLTHSLTRADYGVLAVLNTILALGAGITQLGLSSAFFRAYSYDYESREDRQGIFSTVVLLLSLSSLSVSLAAIIAAPNLSTLLFSTPAFGNALRCVALVILLQNFTVPVFAWLRAESRATFFSLLSIASLLVTLFTTLLFVGPMHLGIVGALLANGTGYAFVVACSLPLILLRVGLRFRIDIARNLLSFGVPLIFNFVSYWVLQLSDRYLLSRFSLEQTASYAVAYSLGGVLSVVILSPFILAWPTAMFSIAKKDNAAQMFQLVFRWFSMLLLFAAFIFSLTCIAALNILFPPSYHTTAPVIPIIAMSLLFYGVYNVFAVGVGVRRKTWLTALFTSLAAIVNLGCNLILIPHFGSLGAALSTLVAYAFLAAIMYIVNQRIYPVPFEIGRFSIALLIGVTLYAGSTLLAQGQNIIVSLGKYLLALILYSGCLLALSKIPLRNLKQKYQQLKEFVFS
jgi:O-antigen/teichoic acid export membrane protein